jgi:hypothetical protein
VSHAVPTAQIFAVEQGGESSGGNVEFACLDGLKKRFEYSLFDQLSACLLQ